MTGRPCRNGVLMGLGLTHEPEPGLNALGVDVVTTAGVGTLFELGEGIHRASKVDLKLVPLAALVATGCLPLCQLVPTGCGIPRPTWPAQTA